MSGTEKVYRLKKTSGTFTRTEKINGKNERITYRPGNIVVSGGDFPTVPGTLLRQFEEMATGPAGPAADSSTSKKDVNIIRKAGEISGGGENEKNARADKDATTPVDHVKPKKADQATMKRTRGPGNRT